MKTLTRHTRISAAVLVAACLLITPAAAHPPGSCAKVVAEAISQVDANDGAAMPAANAYAALVKNFSPENVKLLAEELTAYIEKNNGMRMAVVWALVCIEAASEQQ